MQSTARHARVRRSHPLTVSAFRDDIRSCAEKLARYNSRRRNLRNFRKQQEEGSAAGPSDASPWDDVLLPDSLLDRLWDDVAPAAGAASAPPPLPR